MIRKSGVANRVADLRIDRVAKEAAAVVRQASNHGATERFLSRFLDHLYEADREEYSDLNTVRRRRRRGE